jgi:hypothetical protein
LSLKKREKSVDFFLVLFTPGRLGPGASSTFAQLGYYILDLKSLDLKGVSKCNCVTEV